jgi:hypothetical protein
MVHRTVTKIQQNEVIQLALLWWNYSVSTVILTESFNTFINGIHDLFILDPWLFYTNMDL